MKKISAILLSIHFCNLIVTCFLFSESINSELILSTIGEKIFLPFFKKPIVKGTGDILSPKNPEWIYPTQNSPNEIILKEVCEYAKIFN